MARKKTGWFRESFRHSLASRGMSTKSANAPRPPQLPRSVAYGQHRTLMKRFVVGHGYGGKGIHVTVGSPSGEEMWIEPGEIVELEGISPNGTVWILYKNRRYCAGSISGHSELYPRYAITDDWLAQNIGQELK